MAPSGCGTARHPDVKAWQQRRAAALTVRTDRSEGMLVVDEKGKGSKTAKKANAKADKEGKKNPRKSSAAQSELGKKGAAKKKKKK